MLHTDFFIEKMQMSEVEKVATILTDAFKTNPAYSLIFNKADNPEKGLQWLFEANLFLLNKEQRLTDVIKEKHTGKIIGTYTLVSPEGTTKSISAYMQIGIPRFISEFGFRTLFRMIRMDNLNKKILNESMKTNRYYYLSMVVVEKEYRGLGVGSYAIENCLRNLSASKRNCNLIGLTTQLAENVVFYSKSGFEKIDEGEVVFQNNRYYNYNMKFNVENRETSSYEQRIFE